MPVLILSWSPTAAVDGEGVAGQRRSARTASETDGLGSRGRFVRGSAGSCAEVEAENKEVTEAREAKGIVSSRTPSVKSTWLAALTCALRWSAWCYSALRCEIRCR